MSTDPFGALGLRARPDLTDDDVRAAWRRIAAATHPDRADGGDPGRFAAAAAAYTSLRTPYGRGEAYVDLIAGLRGGYRDARGAVPPGSQGAPSAPSAPASEPDAGAGAGAGAAAGAGPDGAPSEDSPADSSGEAAPGRPWRHAAGSRYLHRLRRGRPVVLALRVAVASGVSAGAVTAVGWQPAAPALITGALTWLTLTARHDLAPPEQ